MKPNSYPLNSPPKVALPHYSRPSVPISVYRQLVDELQTTKAQLSLMRINNQQLEQEVEQLMQSAHKAQQLITRSNRQFSQTTKVTKVKPIWQAKSWESSPQQKVVTVKYSPQNASRQSKNSQEINGWFLAVSIVVIILTAFTSGFLLVRPLLNSNK